MKKRNKILLILSIFILMLTATVPTFAHPGRTDAQGGHRDNKNKSGLGSYHYHCGGHPAHLHKDGVCPYDSSAKSSSSSSSSSSKSTSNSTSKTSKSTSNKPAAVAATTVKFTSTPDELKVGDSGQIEYSISPSDAKNKELTWQSSDKNVATVDSSGNIRALNVGQATITATTSSNKSTSFTLTVNEVKAESLEIKDKVSEIQKNEQLTLSAEILPSNTTNKDITWDSSDPSIAKIDDEGNLVALDAGTVTITASQKDVSDSFELTINPIMPDSVEITTKVEELKKGETLKLEAAVLPEDADDKDVTWTVDDGSIAIIEENILTAIKPGTVTVTATTINGKTDTVQIDVPSDALYGVVGIAAIAGGSVAYYKKRKRKRNAS